MAQKRYKNQKSSWKARPSLPPSTPEFYGLLDLLGSIRDDLPRKSENVLNGYARTLEDNIQAAIDLIHAPAFVSQEREAAVRLTLAQANLSRKQEERNAHHQKASLPARWFGRSIPASLQQELDALNLEVKEAERHLAAVQAQEASLKLQAPRRYPLDSKEHARRFVAQASEFRTLLYQALSPTVRQAEQARLIRDRALAAAHQEQSRSLAESVKKRLRKDHPCPYCGGALGSVPHADHIHPVVHGGLSVDENMVYVCGSCNLQKSDLTLREFARKAGRNREEIERRLEKLGKRV
ncbi:HNH endonuclease [Deinococcus sp. UR1]|uniref:HNH endonuclease n=1 Tax=Deinococcus sp. UR1 TaxID=1704277 RepID=UPI0013041053|nr:HNH endonuclease [Deinococcus sp. UR1]